MPFIEVSRRGAVVGAKGRARSQITVEVNGFVQGGKVDAGAKPDGADGRSLSGAGSGGRRQRGGRRGERDGVDDRRRRGGRLAGATSTTVAAAAPPGERAVDGGAGQAPVTTPTTSAVATTTIVSRAPPPVPPPAFTIPPLSIPTFPTATIRRRRSPTRGSSKATWKRTRGAQ